MIQLRSSSDRRASTECGTIVVPDLSAISIASTEFAYLRAYLKALGDAAALYHTGDQQDDAASLQALRELGFKPWSLPVNAPFRNPKSPHGLLAAGSARLMAWARETRPESLHVVGAPHLPYYLLQARKTGLLDFAIEINLHIITTYGYRMSIGRSAVEHPAHLAKLQMETAALAMADRIVAQSETIARWIIAHQEADARRIEIAPPIPVARSRGAPPRPKGRRPTLLFSGTLTETKGLATAIEALRYLEDEHGISVYAVFSGREQADFPAAEYLEAELGRTNIDVEILPPVDHQTVLERMRGADLVVVPSRLDEYPIVAQECTALGIPVIVAAAGDFVRPGANEQSGAIVVPHDYGAIGDEIARRLGDPATALAQPAAINRNPARREAWSKFIATVRTASPPAPERKPGAGTDGKPLVSICISHFNRPALLELTVESINRQSYDNLELIIVDDGSDADNVAEVEAICSRTPEATLIKTRNRYLGAARNLAAKNARGEYLLFKDDDNYAKPEEVSTFVQCAQHTGADILTCFSDNFRGDGRPDRDALNGIRRMPFGTGPGFNLFRNGFGDSNCLVRFETWRELGGFTEHYKIGLDDHEFFLRAMLRGYRLELIPEALYFYRLGGEKMKRFHVSKHADEQRIMSALLENSDYSLIDIATFYMARRLADDRAP